MGHQQTREHREAHRMGEVANAVLSKQQGTSKCRRRLEAPRAKQGMPRDGGRDGHRTQRARNHRSIFPPHHKASSSASRVFQERMGDGDGASPRHRTVAVQTAEQGVDLVGRFCGRQARGAPPPSRRRRRAPGARPQGRRRRAGSNTRHRYLQAANTARSVSARARQRVAPLAFSDHTNAVGARWRNT